MSKIAIIDTAIDCEDTNGRAVEHIRLCGESKNCIHHEKSHGTICAMVLEHCASDYDLVNIQIFRDNKCKVFGDIAVLAKALKLCKELKVDVVSLSAVSSILSDSKHIYDITSSLSEDAVVVSALDNRQYVSVPTSYPFVLGVRSDVAGLLSPGEIAYTADDPFGANVYANCDFALLQKCLCAPSNSFAVPVVAAYINDLLNQGQSMPNIKSLIQTLKPYTISKEHERYFHRPMSPIEREIPIVFIADGTTRMCRVLMNSLYEKYNVQSTALSLVDESYDIRIKHVKGINTIQKDIHFMKHHYKTDIIFIVGNQNVLDKIGKSAEIDVTLIRQGNTEAYIDYEYGKELVLISTISDRLHEILTS